MCWGVRQASAQNSVQVGLSATKSGAPVLLQRSDADIFAATLAGRYAQGVANPKLAAQAWARAYFRRTSDLDLYDRATAANLEVGNLGMVVRMAKNGLSGLMG
jgi:hypothetical protein